MCSIRTAVTGGSRGNSDMVEVTWKCPVKAHRLYVKIEIAGIYVNALIDTGSDVTIIKEGLAQLFYLKPVKDNICIETTERVYGSKYIGDIRLSKDIILKDYPIFGINMREDALLGLDVLRQFHMFLRPEGEHLVLTLSKPD